MLVTRVTVVALGPPDASLEPPVLDDARLPAPIGLLASVVGEFAPLPWLVKVAARFLALMKLGRNELRGEVGDAIPAAGGGDPFCARPNWAVGMGMWVGREVGRDITSDLGWYAEWP